MKLRQIIDSNPEARGEFVEMCEDWFTAEVEKQIAAMSYEILNEGAVRMLTKMTLCGMIHPDYQQVVADYFRSSAAGLPAPGLAIDGVTLLPVEPVE